MAPISVRSFAKINIGLSIGPARDDGFHELRTIYQTLALHDLIKVDVARGAGIEIRCKDPRVPEDESNTCWRVADRVLRSLRQRGKVTITIDKQLPVQGGLGSASSNAIATMFALERALKYKLPSGERLRIASEVGSDLPLFLLGGTVLGLGRGEQVYPLDDVPAIPIVIATPGVAIATPKAFAAWDKMNPPSKLTGNGRSATIDVFSRSAFDWLSGVPTAGVPAKSGDRAETLLLDLVRAGIENDFENVVFSENPELREVKRALEREGARYASLSGSGSTVYGLFRNQSEAAHAAERIRNNGTPAQATTTLTRKEYWAQIFK
jgi:4-diphosphocytidyl-2-C-methyl-D-erythritol kinase